MKKVATGLGIALVVGMVAGAIAARDLLAQEKKQVYVSPAQKESLVQRQTDLAGRPIVTIDRYTLAPGLVGGKHYHTGPVFVYVLEGAFTIDGTGKPRRTFKAGEVYEEPIGTPMQARNASATKPTKILVVQLTKEGEPPMYKAD